ncbi:unnamed protein product, partial [Rotaria sp. Silwood2]
NPPQRPPDLPSRQHFLSHALLSNGHRIPASEPSGPHVASLWSLVQRQVPLQNPVR